MKSKKFKLSDLVLVSPAPPPDNPSLHVGDHCKLNSGSPALLVVDHDELTVTAAMWRFTGVKEYVFPRECVRRVA